MTSDHGEQFWENGSWGHGQNLHDHQIHVPLLVYLPESVRAELVRASRAKGKGPALVQGAIEDQVELDRPLSDAARAPRRRAREPGERAESGLAARGAGSLPAREAFAEHTNVKENEQKALRTPRFKFIVSIPRKSSEARDESYELYDLKRDPGEQQNLAPGLAARVVELRAKLGRIMDGSDTARDEEVPADIDDALREQLKALGYIGN